MTEGEKRIAIIGGTVVLALLLLFMFWPRFRAAVNSVTGSDWEPPAVGIDIPGINIIGAAPITIPQLDLSGIDGLQMIGACCADCTGSSGTGYQSTPGTTLVFNQGNSGPTVYNYTQQAAPAPSSGSCPPFYTLQPWTDGIRAGYRCQPMFVSG